MRSMLVLLVSLLLLIAGASATEPTRADQAVVEPSARRMVEAPRASRIGHAGSCSCTDCHGA